MASSANNSLPFRPSELGASDGWFMGQDALSSEEESDNSSDSNEELAAQSDISVRKKYIQYLAYAQSNFIAFSRKEVNAIKLLWKLRQTTASLATYADVMEWHLQANNKLRIPDGETSQLTCLVTHPSLLDGLLAII